MSTQPTPPEITPLDYFAWFIQGFTITGRRTKRNSAHDYHVTCPHPDHEGERTPSLHVTLKGDKIVLHCFGGAGLCTRDDTEKVRLLAAVYMSMRDLFVHDLDLEDVLRPTVGKPVVLHGVKPTDPAVEPELSVRHFSGVVSTNMADVVEEAVPWLWPTRFPLGMLTIIAGPPGVGKSYVSLDVTSHVTTGAIWPDIGESAPQGTVVLLSAEDSAKHTIKPRLVALGADCTKVEKVEAVVVEGKKGQQTFSLATDIPRLEQMVLATGAKVVVVDPVNAYLGGKTDGFKDVEIRLVLEPLREMAERLQIAVILIMHVKKGAEDEVVYRIGGSYGFAALARAIFFCTRDPEDATRVYFSNPKMSVGPLAKTLAYRVRPDMTLEWDRDEIKLSAFEILGAQGKPGPKQSARKSVKAWLLEFLGEGPRPSFDGWRTAAEMNFSDSTVRRALDELGVLVESERDEKSGQITGHTWALPPREEPKPF